MKALLAFIVALAAALLAQGCRQSVEPVAKRGSEVENEVFGTLVDVNGKPGEGARVRAQPAGGFELPAMPDNPAAGVVDSALADGQGKYVLRNLPPGEYNLIADRDQGALVSFIPGVAVEQASVQRDLGTDTLRAPGAVEGRITQGGSGKEGVLAYLPGTSFLAFSDSNGDFRVTGVPQGTYAVEYLVAGLKGDPDTAVHVLAGGTTILPPKELGYHTALPPPAPSGVRAVLDTPSSVVRVEWSPVRVADLLGYLVYRDTGTFSSPELRTASILTDTVFLDTVIGLARSPSPPVLTYRILSVDRDKTPSTRYSPPAQTALAPPEAAISQIALRQLDGKKYRAGINDTVRLEVAYANPGRLIRKVTWELLGSATPLRIHHDSAKAGKDTLAHAWPADGSYRINVTVTDETGYARNQIWRMNVFQDIPKADGGADRDVIAGATVHLHGIGIQEFGTIIRYEWDIGATGRFQEAPQGKLDFAAPPIPGPAIPCILRVTDEDGNQGLDTVLITPVLDRPEVDAGPDLEATASDTIFLRGQAIARLGSIVKWEWDAGGTGLFRLSRPDTAIVLPPLDSGYFPCILRVTVDHGGVSLDTMLARIVPDPPIAALTAMPVEATAGNSLTLSGATSTDGHGRIVRWEWDIGNTGHFVPGSGTDTTFTAPAAGTDFWCALRVTDDDGKMDTALTRVLIRAPGTWVLATEFSLPQPLIRLWAVGTGLGKFWILGRGSSDGPCGFRCPVLFSTADFQSWESHAPDSAWRLDSPQFSSLFEFRGRLWFITYANRFENRFWSSPDGDNWSLVSAPEALRQRMDFTAAVFADRIWIIGGTDVHYNLPANDIWSSQDGINWVRETDNPAFGPRLRPGTAEYEGQFWIYGGEHATNGSYLNDIWRSPDGRTWTKIADAPRSASQANTSFLAHAGQLWLIRSGLAESGAVTEAWRSKDGKSWFNIPDPPGFPPSENPILLEQSGRLWMIMIDNGSLNTGGSVWIGP